MKKFLLIFFYLHFSAIICIAQWTQVATINTTQLTGVRFFDETTGIAVGNLGIWRSTNSGINWEQVLKSNDQFNSVSFSDRNNGTAVGLNNLIYKTTNNGLNWIQQSIVPGLSYYDVSCPSQNIAFVCGATNGYVYKTTNGGTSWIPQFTQINVTYYGIFMVNQTTGSLVGIDNSERYFSTGNGGTDWTTLVFNGSAGLRSVYQTNSLNSIATGTNGRIRLSTNGGSNWIFPTSNTIQTLNSVVFLDLNTGYIVADSGIILKSSNGGLNWLREISPVTNSLIGLSIINDQTGWTVGTNGIVLHKGSITAGNENNLFIPAKYYLYKAYPNPFNPTSNIKYDLPKDSKVKLIIYDILGREVKRLVDNELKQAGHYVVEFDGTNFASCVYFYRMEAGTFVDTKKMVLIK